MFKRFLLLIIAIPPVFGFTSTIMACQGELNPEILLIASYENAEHQASEDRMVYQKLRELYGSKKVATIFSPIDDNIYAEILINLINKFNLKKVFILDPKFGSYLPKQSTKGSSKLVRVLQQFRNIDFYFFNNQIADDVKATNNIYEFRFDKPNKKNPNPVTYGALVAKHFYQQLVTETGTVDSDKYKFEVDSATAKSIVRFGFIKQIGSDEQQKIIADFFKELANYVPTDAIYESYEVDVKIDNNYNNTNAQIVENAAGKLYQKGVNFIFNSNYWYNDGIAHAASSAKQPKTTKFIGNSVANPKDYEYQAGNYLLFAYNYLLEILDYTIDNVFPTDYQVADDAPEKTNAFAVNENLAFADGK